MTTFFCYFLPNFLSIIILLPLFGRIFSPGQLWGNKLLDISLNVDVTHCQPRVSYLHFFFLLHYPGDKEILRQINVETWTKSRQRDKNFQRIEGVLHLLQHLYTSNPSLCSKCDLKIILKICRESCFYCPMLY